MPKVFVTQEIAKINYAAALDYGEVVFLTSDEYKSEPTDGRHNNLIKADIARKFVDYVPGEDYVLTSGSPVTILLVGELMGAGSGRLATHKILKWNNQSNKYDLCVL